MENADRISIPTIDLFPLGGKCCRQMYFNGALKDESDILYGFASLLSSSRIPVTFDINNRKVGQSRSTLNAPNIAFTCNLGRRTIVPVRGEGPILGSHETLLWFNFEAITHP